MRLSLIALSLAASANVANAWWASGHMLVADVALKCGIMSDATIKTATSIVEEISSYYPNSPGFIEAACWADDLKSSATAQESNWHFIDIPVIGNPWSGTLPPLPTSDVVPWAISSAQSTIYSTKSTLLDKSRQLRFMIHLVGDIHQPLHAAALYSDQFPDGDMGGNLYPIVLPGSDQWTTELHAVWDGGAGLWTEDIVRPLNSTGTQWLDTLAGSIMTSYPKTDPSIAPLIKQYNTSLWANESNAIATDFVYTAPQAPTVIPDDYLTQAQSICEKQVAIAGYRLADLIEYIFTSTEWGREAVQQVAEKKAEKKNKNFANKQATGLAAVAVEKKPVVAPLPVPVGEDGVPLTHAEIERPALRAANHHRRG